MVHFMTLSTEQSVEEKKSFLEKHAITMSIQKEWSYSYTCDQEINTLATLDTIEYTNFSKDGQRWLVLNPIPNNKHQVEYSRYTNFMTLRSNKILIVFTDILYHTIRYPKGTEYRAEAFIFVTLWKFELFCIYDS